MYQGRKPSILALYIKEKHFHNFARLLTEEQIVWIHCRLREVKDLGVSFALWHFILWPYFYKREKLSDFQLGD